MKKSLFLPGQGETTRFAALMLISFILMFMDLRMPFMATVRGYLATAIYPLQRAVDLPGRFLSSSSSLYQSREKLQSDNQKLYAENQQYRRQLLKYEAVVAENSRLLQLLQSSPQADRDVVVGRLLAIDMTPYQQKVTIDRGSKNGIKPGTPFGDGNGMMGQITRVYYYHSEGLLLSDPTHATPVRVLRNGVRSVAIGTGYTDKLNLLYLPANSDVIVGDMLVTSGLGQRFPADYPVAKITDVDQSGEEIFATVNAMPLANLDKSTEVLLFVEKQGSTNPAVENTPNALNSAVSATSTSSVIVEPVTSTQDGDSE